MISPRMPTRRAVLAACLVWLAASAAERDVPVGGGQGLRIKSDPARLARLRAAKMPEITRPVLFNTAEADGILSALEVFRRTMRSIR